MTLDRRQFIQLSALSALATLAPGVTAAEKIDDHVLLIVFQRGGADGLNTVAPYTLGRYYDARPTIAIAEPEAGDQAGLDLDGEFAFHPAMAPLHALFQAGELAVVHAVGQTEGTRSHFDAQDWMEMGTPAAQRDNVGWLNRYLNDTGRTDSTFRAVALGANVPLALRGDYPAVAVDAIEAFDFLTTPGQYVALRNALGALYADGGLLSTDFAQVIASIDELGSAIPRAATTPAAQYPDSSLGQHLQDAARLIKAGLGAEVMAVNTGGWDHHNGLAADLQARLDDLSRSLAAFRADLGDDMSRVTAITMTEFGRRVEENGSEGTDHGSGGVMLALGGGVRGGQVYADWPGIESADLVDGDLRVTTDYRSVLAEALVSRFPTANLDVVFPGYTPTPLGLFV